VDQVSTGTEADAALALHEFDLVILDLGLPRLHGLEVLRNLRARGSSMAVLILTAADSVEQRVKGLDLGADDYMAKPFSLQELEARVRALTRQAQVQNHQIKFMQGQRRIRLGAGAHLIHRVARGPQRAQQCVRQYLVVFCNEDAHGGFRSAIGLVAAFYGVGIQARE
jgi:DNA-binding response OmpR family regulator